jgi:hypothetical protein
MSMKRILLLATALAFLALAFAPAASAHASMNTADGEYRVTWGFLDEPAYTHQKNRLDLTIRDAATGIGGLTAANLTVKLVYGEDEYDLGNISAYRGAKGGAFAGDGNYTSANHVWVTREGIYSLAVTGDIRGSPVDLTIPAAHEYHSMSHIAFPDDDAFPAGSDTSALEARIAALEEQVSALRAQVQTQSETPATLTPQTPAASPDNGVPAPLFVLALGAVAAALVLRRRT